MDVHTKQQRSYNMSQVRSKNTKPELMIFNLLKDKGYSFKKHYDIVGKPDFVFLDCRVAIFIDGEFWHGKNFKDIKEKLPPFWVKKIGNNIKRDRRNSRKLRSKGWHVMRIWDKKINKKPQLAVRRIIKFVERTRVQLRNQEP